ncbi:hypothetical protein EYZ11_003619 [Aspergillus tanneri]|uniref:NmrA-like domain-containing protein n=1 Tax=Aspergillus tanneri TaxID=1220188 RepID=A0A4S3JMV1_9EURO|nr:uncharacterized protein ATNIH1004_006545 [Aspergillus tanneri]KAA8647843.1 hypothetical protein ATNIH1004_006545 [Aspergillus tanneri]THC96902.1 hypothetical protein EYZ11_003619 [Aspergillus tanneri]
MSVIQNVVIAGATGNLGGAILSALLSSGRFNVTAFSRDGSKSVPSGVTCIQVDYDSIPNLASHLAGQDAVVSVLGTLAMDAQKNLIQAAANAKVTRFIPSEFGSDLENAENRSFPVFAGKVESQNILKSLADEGRMTYTFVSNGAFLDWGLKVGFILDLKNRKAVLHDGGNRKFSATTLATVGKTVVGILTHAEETKNRLVKVSEFGSTLKELLQLSQSITGADGWDITVSDTAVATKKAMELVKQGVYTDESMFPFVFKAIWGYENGGFYSENDNELLGIEQLSLPNVKEIILKIAQDNP